MRHSSKKSETQNDENTEDQNNSQLFEEISGLVDRLTDFDDIQFRKKATEGKKNNPDYLKLYNDIKDGKSFEVISKQRKSKKNFRDLLLDLRDVIIEATIPISLKDKTEIFLQMENSFRLGLNRKGFTLMEKLNTLMSPEDFWVRWRFVDLKWQYGDVQNRNNEPYRDDLYRIAQTYISQDTCFPENFHPDVVKSDFFRVLSIVKKKSDQVALELGTILENLSITEHETYEPRSESNSILFPKRNEDKLVFYINHLFQILNYIWKNKVVLKPYDYKLYTEIIKRLNNSILFMNNGTSGNILPNSFTLYSENLLTNLKTALLLTNQSLNAEKWGEMSDFNEVNIEDIVTRIEVLKCVGRIFIYDEYLDKTHFERLTEVLIDLGDLLNQRNKIPLSKENREGLMCLYIMLANILNKDDVNRSGTKNRFMKALKDHPIYAPLSKTKVSKGLEMKVENFMQAAVWKLYCIMQDNKKQ